MGEPRVWTRDELVADAATATGIFRAERLKEPLDGYNHFFATFAPIFGELIDKLSGSSDAKLDPAIITEMVRNKDRLTALRYLTAPPMSEDDLKTLAETKLSASALQKNPERAKTVRDIVLNVIDPHRFPWIAEGRKPSEHECRQAIIASTAMVAARKMETFRRNDAKKVQESHAKEFLQDIHFTKVPPREIPLLDAAPAPGEFCGESKLGDTRADIVVRLYDRRAMPIECKVSNSSVNSYKRLIHEAGGKATKWLDWFGRRQTVPAAILSGVFSPANLEAAQRGGLSLFWSHRLGDLADFIESTRPAP